MEGFIDQNSSYQLPVYQTIVWMKLDTLLNVVQQKRYRLGINRQSLSELKMVRHAGFTYGVVTYWRDYNGGLNRLQGKMLKFDSAANLIILKEPDGPMYNTTLNYNAGIFWDISVEPQSSKLYVAGEIMISSSTDSVVINGQRILHKFDTAFVLEDTFQVRRVGTDYAGHDTFTNTTYFYTAPVGPDRILLGSLFWTLFASTSGTTIKVRPGLSLYSTTGRKHRLRTLAPGYSPTEVFSKIAYNKGVDHDGLGHACVVSASEGGATPLNGFFSPTDNKLSVARYDTAANLLWHRFLGTAGAYYTPCNIKCEGDSIITVLAGRYDYINSPGVEQRDFYVLRLRASDGTPTAVFQVPIPRTTEPIVAYPNPTTDVLRIRIPTSVKATEISILSSTGATLRRVRTATHGDTEIPVADLAPGIYTYRLHGADGASGASGLFLKR